MFKRQHGTTIEKITYQQQTGDDVDHFITRLIKQRPLAFLTNQDSTLLRNGQFIANGKALWEVVGTSEEQQPITMIDYLT